MFAGFNSVSQKHSVSFDNEVLRLIGEGGTFAIYLSTLDLPWLQSLRSATESAINYFAAKEGWPKSDTKGEPAGGIDEVEASPRAAENRTNEAN